MLRLSPSQLDLTTEHKLADFDDRMTRALIGRYGQAHDIDADTLRPHVTQARHQARACGFRTEQHIFDVVEAYAVTGEALWSDPRFHDIVRAPFKSAEEKARTIRQVFVPVGAAP